MYKCAKCGEGFDKLTEGVIRCPVCAFRVVYKKRGPISKNIQAR